MILSTRFTLGSLAAPELGNNDGVMPKEKSPGKATTRRYTDIEKEPSVKLCRQLAADVGDGLAGPDAQRVRDLEAENKEMSQEPRSYTHLTLPTLDSV